MMKSKSISILLFFSAGVLSVSALVQVEPCDSKDIICLRKLVSTFFEQTAPGIPELGIAKSDPLVVPPFDVSFGEMGLNFKLKNINVAGLKDMFLDQLVFKKHVVYKSVHMVYKNNFTISSDILIENTKDSKSYDGSFTSRAAVIGGFTYTFDTKKVNEDRHHFQLNNHVLTCELENSPQLNFNSELAQKLDNDYVWKGLYEDELKVIREVTFCKIAREVYDTAMYNWQTVLQYLPAHHFLKDMTSKS